MKKIRWACAQRIFLGQLIQIAQQNPGDILAGGLGLHRADVIGDHRHPVHHAGFLVLAEGERALFAHCL